MAKFFIIAWLTNTSLLIAQSHLPLVKEGLDPRGESELVICSQNLENYGTVTATAARTGLSSSEVKIKESALIKRFALLDCDVIAVQEILSNSEEQGEKVLEQLSAALRGVTARFYDVRVGSSKDPNLRSGFLVAKDRAEILNSLSYTKVELPRITPDQKPRFFSRGPFEIQISVKPRGEGKPRIVTLINIHFKSRAGGAGDPTGLEWETYRMEMAEALRRIVESRHRKSLVSAEYPLVVLGDRNGNFDLASAKILEGALSLSEFQSEGPCRLSKRGLPLCKEGAQTSQILFSVLTGDPQMKQQPGTFHFKKTFSWIDDILMPVDTLRLAWEKFDQDGDYDSGVVYNPAEASDHSMIWVKMNW